MNIFILTLGSLGDVQPYIALGKGLKEAGHTVTVCTAASFEPMITRHDLCYGYMNDEFVRLAGTDAGKAAVERSGSPLGSLRSMLALMKETKQLFGEMLRDAWKAAQVAVPDVVIFHPKSLGGPSIAEKLGVPVLMALPVPVIVPTAESVAIGFPDLKLGRWYNRLSYAVLDKGYHTYDDVVDAFRQEVLGLGRLPKNAGLLRTAGGQPIHVLHGYSEHVSPRPLDWPATAHITGYWFLDDQPGWQPPEALESFLAAGDPPVYIGFGSMAGRDPQRMAQLVVDALRLANRRGILATGWGGLDATSLPETIIKIEQAPHTWLFPRCSAVVHHGGAGTTAAGLRYGRPTVVTPFMVDQPYWGARVYALGAGSRPVPRRHLTTEKLADAIREVTTSPAIRQNAAALGEKIRAENGVARAITIIEQVARE